jgi:uncharacterized phiE125 gp8 family phage protein
MERAYNYHVIEEPINLPVTLPEVKEHLKLDPADNTQDDYLTFLVWSVAKYTEEYTKRILINTKFRTYRDIFQNYIKLRRSKLQSLDKFEYLVDDVFTTVPIDLYYVTDETAFSKIVLTFDEEYPINIDNRMQAIKIEFTAGYGTESTDIPQQLRLALLNHLAKVYENRGDCDTDLSTNVIEQFLPKLSRGYYEMYRIRDYLGDCYP